MANKHKFMVTLSALAIIALTQFTGCPLIEKPGEGTWVEISRSAQRYETTWTPWERIYAATFTTDGAMQRFGTRKTIQDVTYQQTVTKQTRVDPVEIAELKADPNLPLSAQPDAVAAGLAQQCQLTKGCRLEIQLSTIRLPGGDGSNLCVGGRN